MPEQQPKDTEYSLNVIQENEYKVNYEKQLNEMITFFQDLDCIVNVTSEFDILLEDYDIAINFRGLNLYTHDKTSAMDYNKKDYELADQKKLRLVTIFSDEWTNNRTKVEDTLRYFVQKAEKGIPARKCTIREIVWKDAKPFLNKYHLLNSGSPTKIKLGAFYKDDLIAVMTFGRPSSEKGVTDYYEMTRFVTDKKTHPGLASKMFKHAVKEYSLTKVVAFVDKRWFTGGFKLISGFEVIGKTHPTKWYTDGTQRFHRRFITKKTLTTKYGFSSEISKNVAMYSLGYKIIYDCGKIKLEWKAKET